MKRLFLLALATFTAGAVTISTLPDNPGLTNAAKVEVAQNGASYRATVAEWNALLTVNVDAAVTAAAASATAAGTSATTTSGQATAAAASATTASTQATAAAASATTATSQANAASASATTATTQAAAASASAASAAATAASVAGYSVEGLLIWGVMDPEITTVAVTSNVVTITVDEPHALLVGQKVLVDCSVNAVDKTSSADPAVVTAVTSTTFTYSLTTSNLASQAATGNLRSWELVTDTTHVPTYNLRIQSIATSGLTLTWDGVPPGSYLNSAVLGQHSNSSYNEGRWIGVGTATATFQMIHTRTISGRLYNNTGVDPTTSGGWTKKGDTASAVFASANNGLFIGHSSSELPTNGGTSPDSFPLPLLQGHGAYLAQMPDFVTGFGGGYQPSGTGFYCQVRNPATGAALTAAEIQAAATGAVQLSWQRSVRQVLTDHTMPTGTCTVFICIRFRPAS